jgi:hypothetical protein
MIVPFPGTVDFIFVPLPVPAGPAKTAKKNSSA